MPRSKGKRSRGHKRAKQPARPAREPLPPPDLYRPAHAARASLAVFAVMMLFYAAMGQRHLQYGDPPELITAAVRLGIAHPSGYPLFTMLGYLFSHLPIGTLVYRMGLMSGLFGALSCGVLCLFCCRLCGKLAPSVLASIAFGLTPVMWWNSTNFEVYSMNAFFVVLGLLLAAEVWAEAGVDPDRRRHRFYGLGLVVGLGISHHLTYIVMLPAVAWMALRGRQTWLPTRAERQVGILCLVLGLSPWAYLYIRGTMPFDRYTCWANLDTLGKVIGHITGREYGSHPFAYGLSAVPKLAHRDFNAFAGQSGWLLLFVPFGVAGLRRQTRRGLEGVLALLAVNVALVFGAHGGYTEFFTPSYVCVGALLAVGIGWLVEWAASSRLARWSWLPLLLAVSLLAAEWPERFQDIRPMPHSAALNYIKMLERTVPPDAVVVLHMKWKNPDHLLFPLLYAKRVVDRLPGLSFAHPSQFTETEDVRAFLDEIGASEQLRQQVLGVPEAERLEAFMRCYDGARPLYSDTPAVFEKVGKGGAYHGYLWRVLPESRYDVDLEAEQFLAWSKVEKEAYGDNGSLLVSLCSPLLNWVHYLYATHQYARARGAALELLEVCDETDNAAFYCAYYLSQMGYQSDAWRVWREMAESLPFDAVTYALEALLQFNEREYRLALRALDRADALDKAAEKQQVTYLRAASYLQLGEPEKAKEVAGPVMWSSIQRQLQHDVP